MILCDTNVLIDAFNRRPATLAALDGIGYDRVVLSAVTVMELYRGTRNKEQLAQLRRRIRYFGVVRFSEAVADLATGYIEAFHLPHGLEIPDALIAATAVAYQLPLFTYNRKDFHFIPGLQLYEAQ